MDDGFFGFQSLIVTDGREKSDTEGRWVWGWGWWGGSDALRLRSRHQHDSHGVGVTGTGAPAGDDQGHVTGLEEFAVFA